MRLNKQTLKRWLVSGLLSILFFSQPNITMFTDNNPITSAIAENENSEVFEKTETHPVVSFSSNPWNHDMMNIQEAWADGYTGEGITIAILDTGFDIRHPDLNMAGGNSVFPDDPWSNDHSGHGTHIAGIIGALPGSTYQGIAPNADLYGIKIYHEDDVDEAGFVATDVNSVVQGIQLAMDVAPDIIVLSSGLTYDDKELHDIIIEAHNRGILIIAASGNGNASVNYPASYPEVIAVTAIDERLNPALDIIYGQENDFAAPGVNIGGLSIPESSYSYPYILMSGSSQAVPHAAGLAAILMEKHGVRGDDIRQIMKETAQDIGDPGFYGHGLLKYVADETIVSEDPETNNENTEEEEEIEEEETIDAPQHTAQKPISSRAPDIETEEETLPETSAFYSVEAIEQGEHAALPKEIIALVETGGTLEIGIQGFGSLYLSSDQIKDIRDRNISLRLAKEQASWRIPPANLLPGAAILHFYEGTPLGIEEHDAPVATILTTNINQPEINRSIYPSEMEIRIQMNESEEEDLNRYESFAWDKEVEGWFEPLVEVSIEDGIKEMVILTRHTTTMGIYDPDLITEEEEENLEVAAETTVEPSEGMPITSQMILGIVGFILLFGIVWFFLRKRKT